MVIQRAKMGINKRLGRVKNGIICTVSEIIIATTKIRNDYCKVITLNRLYIIFGIIFSEKITVTFR